MMLRHSDDPAALIQGLAMLLPADAWAIIAEFHPDGPCSLTRRATRAFHPSKSTSGSSGLAYV